MRRLRRKNANKELSALARLNEREIDTSDIPEIKDWSSAIVGRFHKSGEQQSSPQPLNSGTLTNDRLIALGDTNIRGANSTEISEVTSDQIVKACIRGTPAAWSEFMHRYHRLIASVVLRTSRQWGIQSAKYVEDLIQEVYVRLCADGCRLLRMYQGDYTKSFFSYLKVIATNVVHDHFRAYGDLSRGKEMGQVLHEANASQPGKADSPTSSPEAEVLFEAINTILKTTASENERVIFWLYYKEGFTASEIAAVPRINLTEKGIEGLLHRLLRRIKSELTKQDPKHRP